MEAGGAGRLLPWVGEAGEESWGWGGGAEVVVGPWGWVGVPGLTAQGAGEVLEALEAEASFEADVVPGAGAVVVGAEEVLDAPKVYLDVEQQLAEPLALEERAAVCQASL